MSSVTDEIKDRLDIVDIVSETVNLRKAGKNYTGFCPFHSNTRTPAFVVFPETGTWRCFSCNEGGDLFSYVMKKEGWDFQETLTHLADKAGVQLKPQTEDKKEEEHHIAHLRTILEDCVIFFQHQLLQTEGGAEAKAYLDRRGLTLETIRKFGLGYAPAGWENTLQYLLGKDYKPADLLESGIVSERERDGSLFDRFRHRVMFPIRDGRGKICGFGARALSDEDHPKYLNSPQNLLFDKSRILYGLDMARKSIRQEDQVVIVEGYMDVIGLNQAGFLNAVSPMGTALNEHHFRMLNRFTRNYVLALDPDEAGQKATMRGLELARTSLERSVEVTPGEDGIFDPRGLIRYESRLKADLRVTTLPDGVDPDELVLDDREAWPRLLSEAKPIVEHVMESMVKDVDLEDAKVKREIAEEILPIIDDVASPVERDVYRQRLARLLKINEKVLMNMRVQHVKRSSSRYQQPGVDDKQDEPVDIPRFSPRDELVIKLESQILFTLIHYPDFLHRADRALQHVDLDPLSEKDFRFVDHRALFSIIGESLSQDDVDPELYIKDHMGVLVLNSPVKDVIEENESSESQKRRLEEMIRIIFRLRSINIEFAVEELNNLQLNQESLEDGETDYNHMIFELTMHKSRLERANGAAIKLD